MSQPQPSLKEIARDALHAVIFVMAAAIILLPELRQGRFMQVYYSLFLVESVRWIRRAWRLGYLRQTPREIHGTIQARERLRAGWLELAVMVTAYPAFFLIIKAIYFS